MDLRSRQVLAERQDIIDAKSIELQRLEPIDREVVEFLKAKSVLQRQINMITVLKQNQKTVLRGVPAVALVRTALRRQGSTGDADARLRARPRARGPRLRDRARHRRR